MLLDFPFASGLAVSSTVDRRQEAIDLLRSISLRLLAAIPPGDVRFVFVDPVALGRSVAEQRALEGAEKEIAAAERALAAPVKRYQQRPSFFLRYCLLLLKSVQISRASACVLFGYRFLTTSKQ